MPNTLGIRLRIAREKLGLTQEALSKSLHLSSEFISLLELGKRAPSLETLKSLAEFFQEDVSYFLETREGPQEKLFGLAAKDKGMKGFLTEFFGTCEAVIALENSLGLRQELAPQYTAASAEDIALNERSRLGAGLEPIKNAFAVFERQGLHIIRNPFPAQSKISGIFVFFEQEQSAFALINSVYAYNFQVFIAAHEYFHFLKDRHIKAIADNADVFVSEYLPLYHPREKRAFSFALNFLMPRKTVEDIIRLEFRSSRMKYKDVLFLSRYFGATPMTMLYALFEYGLIPASKLKEFQKNGASGEKSDAFSGFSDEESGSERLKWLVLEALQGKKMDLVQAAKLLHMEKSKLQKLLKL